MAVASQLSRHYEVRIVAHRLPGDELTQDWASPWACAGWVALGGTRPEQKMQLRALKHWLKLAEDHPESSVRRVRLTEVHDVGAQAADNLWYRDNVPGFELLDAAAVASEYGGDAKSGARYASVVLTPRKFLPWLRSQLEYSGVRFERIGKVAALSDLKYLGHDVLVNASGSESLVLTDVRDDKVTMDRTYITVVKSEYQEAFVRRSLGQYTYMFSRGDGTVAVGGISEPVREAVKGVEEVRAGVCDVSAPIRDGSSD